MTLKREEIERFRPDAYPAAVKEQIRLTYEEAEGSVAEIPLYLIKGADAGPVLLMLAAIHGDEYEGVQTIIELGRMLSPADIRGTLLMVPIANAYAYRTADRLTPEDGRNLAREFPGKREGTVTERLAWHLGKGLIKKADFLLDMHSGGTYYEVPEFVGYYDNDGCETGRRSSAAAEAFGFQVLWGHDQVSPGRTVSYAGDCGIPWLYTEAFGGRRVKRDEQHRLRQGALRLMGHLGMLVSPSQWIPEETKPEIRYRLTGNGDFDGSVTAEEEGFFIPSVALLQNVRQGDEIGIVYNGFGEILRSYRAVCDGVIVGLAGAPVLKRGSLVYLIALLQE
ncbi:succinylglutamate desuccinylase/aspartoacylase family protein [Paenibacillus nasutitermitis]|uniref:N-alpha-acetyl diaminobutyric acid deacetylase DoeB n=1 Tax=Paenibacillus nasutitermitis TaxID=1652958 RepID=A0A916YQB9_9BACL|nr:succinylglutamate desuccinylase/aspartoacylase family protein [Paenibacillus nasutitermitis]GGD56450.1 N-alpha-acetyl diaminobutyric acid deacetylase DoeB [Paenibacillus nasutitermitis]